MKIYPEFSEITQIKMCLSSINHEDEKISLLYDDDAQLQVIIIIIDAIEMFLYMKIIPVYSLCSYW
jgi:hypothetical protein